MKRKLKQSDKDWRRMLRMWIRASKLTLKRLELQIRRNVEEGGLMERENVALKELLSLARKILRDQVARLRRGMKSK